MLRCGCSANAKVMRRRRGDTMSAPMPETFSWERARTERVGVAPHGAHVRRSSGIIKNPGSSRQTRWVPSRCSFFYRGPLHLDPLTHATIVALFGAWLGALRSEATGAEQASHVIGMVDDLEVSTDQVDDSSTRPPAGAIAGRFGPGHDQAHQSTALPGADLRRSPRGRPGAEAAPALSSVGPLPSPHGAPIDAEAVRHHMHGDITLQQVDRTKASLLEFRRAPLWAHGVPPTGEHSPLGRYLAVIN